MTKQDHRSHEETRERILATAELLFAERGFEATSVRDITSGAECNIASVNYYFGTKEKLYLETAHQLLSDLRERQSSQLQEQLHQNPDADLEEFLLGFARGFIDPLEDGAGPRPFLRFFTREMLDPHLPPHLFFSELIGPMMELTLPVLMRLVPELKRDAAILCMMSIVSQLHHILKTRTFMPEGISTYHDVLDSESYLQHVARFSAAGIRACAGSKEAV